MDYLTIINGRAYIGVSFDLNAFPEMIHRHGQIFPGTLEMEDAFRGLIDAPFDSIDRIHAFVSEVCRWGGYAGIAGRVINNNNPARLMNAFEGARNHLSQPDPDLAAALASLNRLHGFGAPSFASKHLRFLRPQLCPVYDGILNNKLPYDPDPAGYALFAADCRAIGRALCKNEIENPQRNEVTWHAADVEAAIFAEFYLDRPM